MLDTALRGRLIPLALGLIVAAPCRFVQGDDSLRPLPSYENLVAPLVDNYCSACHTGEDADGGLSFDKLDGGEGFQQHRAEWREIARRLLNGTMPPDDADPLSPEERQEWVAWINSRLAELDCSGPVDPGWITLRRLNRDQYRNTIHDLLGVTFNPDEHFPPDELGYGFDNNGDVLMLSPALVEKYLAAANTIASQAILPPESIKEPARRIVRRRWEGGVQEGDQIRALYTNGAIEFEHQFETPGTYFLVASVSADQAGDEPVRVGFLEQGEIVKTLELWDDQVWETVHLELEVPEGKRKLAVAFLNDFYLESDNEGESQDRNLRLRRLHLVGPLDPDDSARPEAHRRFFAQRPKVSQWRDDQAWRPLARQAIGELTMNAFRRPASTAEIDRYVELADSARRAGDSYERAMQLVLEAVLVSSKFLFIGNLEPEPCEEVHLVDEFELASRLSYFLWSSMPDQRLLNLAAEGKLRSQLREEVDRMLASERVAELAKNFTGQWLGTRLLADTHPDEELFPRFDDELRQSMAREAELVVAELLRQNASILSLINADFTFLNEPLAEHYGISGVKGKNFRRVSLKDLPPEVGVRGGVVTMAGVLTTTSFPTRTAPVLRGKWILGELLGREPPPPPPDVPLLDEGKSSESAASLREQLEQHRQDPTCASCHIEMDGLGFALESFDAIGRWRAEENGHPIDATGELPGGERVEGVRGLQQALLARGDEFRHCFAEKMLTYALARGLEYQDECSVVSISEHLKSHDDRFQELIHAIVASDPFQKRRGTISPKED